MACRRPASANSCKELYTVANEIFVSRGHKTQHCLRFHDSTSMRLVSLKRLKEYLTAAPSRERPSSIFIDEQKRIRDTLRADRDHKQWHFVNLRGAAQCIAPRPSTTGRQNSVTWKSPRRNGTLIAGNGSEFARPTFRSTVTIRLLAWMVGLHSYDAWEM
jgi:hypothetical protein